MKNEEIQKQIDELIAWEVKRQIVEGYKTDNEYFKVVNLPLSPKLEECNRVKEILNGKTNEVPKETYCH